MKSTCCSLTKSRRLLKSRSRTVTSWAVSAFTSKVRCLRKLLGLFATMETSTTRMNCWSKWRLPSQTQECQPRPALSTNAWASRSAPWKLTKLATRGERLLRSRGNLSPSKSCSWRRHGPISWSLRNKWMLPLVITSKPVSSPKRSKQLSTPNSGLGQLLSSKTPCRQTQKPPSLTTSALPATSRNSTTTRRQRSSGSRPACTAMLWRCTRRSIAGTTPTRWRWLT
mmetsp:Transcript_22217/g.32436  ORF Transcript_22217/g.32436 Transcript_22217/m.32436 type:complete len:226 (-) Transcript_22217:2291-2968(-)